MSVWHGACAHIAFRLPLLRAARTLRKFPLVFEQMLEEVVTPFCRRAGPGDFEAAGYSVARDARGVGAGPAEALFLNGRAFGFRSNVWFGGTGSVGLAESMPSRDQSDGFFIVHGHPA